MHENICYSIYKINSIALSGFFGIIDKWRHYGNTGRGSQEVYNGSKTGICGIIRQ